MSRKQLDIRYCSSVQGLIQARYMNLRVIREWIIFKDSMRSSTEQRNWVFEPNIKELQHQRREDEKSENIVEE